MTIIKLIKYLRKNIIYNKISKYLQCLNLLTALLKSFLKNNNKIFVLLDFGQCKFILKTKGLMS